MTLQECASNFIIQWWIPCFHACFWRRNRCIKAFGGGSDGGARVQSCSKLPPFKLHLNERSLLRAQCNHTTHLQFFSLVEQTSIAVQWSNRRATESPSCDVHDPSTQGCRALCCEASLPPLICHPSINLCLSYHHHSLPPKGLMHLHL